MADAYAGGGMYRCVTHTARKLERVHTRRKAKKTTFATPQNCIQIIAIAQTQSIQKNCHFTVGMGRGWSKPCSPRRSGLTCWHVGQTRTNSATSCFMLGNEYWRATTSKVFRGPQCPQSIPVRANRSLLRGTTMRSWSQSRPWWYALWFTKSPEASGHP